MLLQKGYIGLIQGDPNLVGYWRLDESTGTPSFFDGSTNKSNTGALTGITVGTTMSYVTNDTSTGSTFNGTTSVASIGTVSSLDQFTRTQPFTIIALVSPNITKSGGSTSYQLYTKATGTGTLKGITFGLRYLGAGNPVTWAGTTGVFLQFGSNFPTQWIQLLANPDLVNGVTYLVGVTYSGATGTSADVQFYIDGNPVNSFDPAFGTSASESIAPGQDTTAPASAAEIGRWGSTVHQWFKGDAKDLAIFNVAQTPLWMKKLASMANPSKTLAPVVQSSVYTPYTKPRPQVIYDLDIDSDAGDAAEEVMMLNLEHQRKLDIVAMVVTSGNSKAAPAALAIANYYGRADIPTCAQGTIAPGNSGSLFDNTLAAGPFAVPGKTDATQFETPVTLVRRILASASPRSIDWIVNGTVGSVQMVLQTTADQYSPLSGVALIAAKCRSLWIMGGNWPSGNGVSDFSVPSLPANGVSSQYVLTHWPTTVPTLLASITEGGSIQYGKNVMEALDATNPARIAWELFFGNASVNNIDGGWSSPSFLAMINGFGSEMVVQGGSGTASIDTGTNITTWNQIPNSNHHFIVKSDTDASLVTKSNALIIDKTAW